MKKVVLLTGVALVALVCSIGTLAAAPASSGETLQQAPSSRLMVTGVVTDFAGNPLAGVSVSVRGAANVGTSTDASGRYSITVARGATLEFSFIGMRTREVRIDDQSTGHLNVQLEDEALVTDEVVVTGVFDRPKESFTGAAAIISKEELRASSTQNLLSGISNVDPSFKFIQSNVFGSDPNKLTQANITMRGGTALLDYQNDAENAVAANRPIFVIDGFPATIEQFLALDQSRVESVTTLKDAAATALYGTEAANGVVVVTTVRPEEGRLRVAYNGTYAIEAPMLGSYNLMNSAEKLKFELESGLYDGTNDLQKFDLMNVYYARMMDVARGVDTDWLSYPLRNAFSHNHSLSLSGGENSIRYSVDISNNRKSSVMRGSYRNTFSGGMYLNYSIDDFVFANRLTVTSMVGPNSPYGSFADYTKFNAYYTPYNGDGTIKRILDSQNYYVFGATGSDVRKYSRNPLYNAGLPNIDEQRYTEIQNNFSAEWKINEYLKAKGSLALTSQKSRTDRFKSSGHTDFDDYSAADQNRKGSYTYVPGEMMSTDTRLSLQYSRYFNEKHFLLLGVSGRYNTLTRESFTIEGEGITIPYLDFFPAANLYKKDGNPGGMESILHRMNGSFLANYMYDERYYADLTVSMDGSSEYGESRSAAPTGALGVGWNMHKEDFMAAQNLVSRARVRTSYGLVGSAGNYNTYDALRMYDMYATAYRDNNGMRMSSIGNPDLKWQTTKQFNVGVDLGFVQNRYTVVFDWYDKVTNDLITEIGVASASGLRKYKANIGKVRNRGFELGVSAKIIQNRERQFEWTVMANANQNKNTILEIGDFLNAFNDQVLSTEGKSDAEINAIRRNPAFLYREGESMNTIFAVKSKGIDPATGREVFVKLDGTETYTWDNDDRRALGTTDPKLWGTFGSTVRWRGFALTAWFSYTTGAHQYNRALANKIENIMPFYNADRRALYDRWLEPGDVASFKGVREWRNETRATSRFVAKENVLRCTSLSLQYTVPQEWAKRYLGAQFLEVQAQTEDLFYLTTLEDERGVNSPFSRNFSMTLRVTF